MIKERSVRQCPAQFPLGQFAHQHDFALVFKKKSPPRWQQQPHAPLVRAGCRVTPWRCELAAVAGAEGQSPRLLPRYSSARDSDGHGVGCSECPRGYLGGYLGGQPRAAVAGHRAECRARWFNSSLAPSKSSTTRGPTAFRGCVLSFSFWLADCHG